MKKNVLYIATASWEERFLEGAKRVLEANQCTDALCFWFEDYEARTAEAREAFKKQFASLNPKFEKLKLLGAEGTPPVHAEMWRRIFEVLADSLANKESFVFDITTTPRVALWIILDLLTEAKLPGIIYYHRAGKHGHWCGCEPDRPQLVPKLGGISSLEKETKLLVVTGFDEDRSEHFISHYEPTETLILLQEGSETDAERNRDPHLKRFRGRPAIQMVKMNSYAPDWGYATLEKEAVKFGSDSNLVLASVGPKTSAVSLYKLHRLLPHSSMVYSPCRDYNDEYSSGIGETLSLAWNPKELPNSESLVD